MSPRSRRLVASARCFPRVSGDEPSKSAVLVFFGSFSPRERG